MKVPVRTVSQATIAMTQVPISSRGVRSLTPSAVRRRSRRLHSPARPPPNASRNNVPRTSPCRTVNNSRSVSSIPSLPSSRSLRRYIRLPAVRFEDERPSGTERRVVGHVAGTSRTGPMTSGCSHPDTTWAGAIGVAMLRASEASRRRTAYSPHRVERSARIGSLTKSLNRRECLRGWSSDVLGITQTLVRHYQAGATGSQPSRLRGGADTAAGRS
jgi:hypothetical protein